jgi:hypothetical protein
MVNWTWWNRVYVSLNNRISRVAPEWVAASEMAGGRLSKQHLLFNKGTTMNPWSRYIWRDDDNLSLPEADGIQTGDEVFSINEKIVMIFSNQFKLGWSASDVSIKKTTLLPYENDNVIVGTLEIYLYIIPQVADSSFIDSKCSTGSRREWCKASTEDSIWAMGSKCIWK